MDNDIPSEIDFSNGVRGKYATGMALPCKRCKTDTYLRWVWSNPEHWTGDVQDISPEALWAVNCQGCGYVGPQRASRAAAGEAWNAEEGLRT